MMVSFGCCLLVGAAMSGICCASSGAWRDKTSGDLLNLYRVQVNSILGAATQGTLCYNDYIAKVKGAKQQPPRDALMTIIHDCRVLSGTAWLSLRSAQRTAQHPLFKKEGLITKGLPDVLDTRQKHQGPHTKNLQSRLAELENVTEAAFGAYEAAREAKAKVLNELKKASEFRQINVSRLDVKMHKMPDGGMQMAVLGVAVAGVAVAGVITYEPFVEAAIETATAIESLDDAVTRLGETTVEISQLARQDPLSVQVGMAARLRDEKVLARRLLNVADQKLTAQQQIVQEVSVEEQVEAAIVSQGAWYQIQDAHVIIERAAIWHIWFKQFVRRLAF